jgi:hypothetical protein
MQEEKQDIPHHPEDDLTAWQSLRNSLIEEYLKILRWVKPDASKNRFLEYLKWIYKIPVLVFATLVSPIAFVLIAIVFFATL